MRRMTSTPWLKNIGSNPARITATVTLFGRRRRSAPPNDSLPYGAGSQQLSKIRCLLDAKIEIDQHDNAKLRAYASQRYEAYGERTEKL